MSNSPSLKLHTVAEVARVIAQNPQRFMEQLNENLELRQNLSAILKTSNPSQIHAMAYELQSSKVKNPITNAQILIEPFAQNTALWMSHEARMLKSNPYHEMQPPKEVFDFFKKIEEDEEFMRLNERKRKEIVSHVIQRFKTQEESLKMIQAAYELKGGRLSKAEEQAFQHAMLEKYKAGRLDEFSDNEMNMYYRKMSNGRLKLEDIRNQVPEDKRHDRHYLLAYTMVNAGNANPQRMETIDNMLRERGINVEGLSTTDKIEALSNTLKQDDRRIANGEKATPARNAFDKAVTTSFNHAENKHLQGLNHNHTDKTVDRFETSLEMANQAVAHNNQSTKNNMQINQHIVNNHENHQNIQEQQQTIQNTGLFK